MHSSFMRVTATKPFSFLGNQAEITVITPHKYNIAEPPELIEKLQNYVSFMGKSAHFQSNHLNKNLVGNKRWACTESKPATHGYALKTSDFLIKSYLLLPLAIHPTEMANFDF